METPEQYNTSDNLKINEQLDRIRGLEADLQVLSISLRRANMANALAQPYGGNRDMYKVLGYKTELDIDDYTQAYSRNDMGGRIIDLAPKDTWRRPPKLKENGQERTPWLLLFEVLAKRLDLLTELTTVDRISGIGRYGVLLIGARENGNGGGEDSEDGTEAGDLSEPLGRLSGPESILYLRSASEDTAKVTEIEDNVASPRYGLPTEYLITTSITPTSSGDAQQSSSKKVHWSRVIHIAEDTLDDKVYGRPRLKRVYNRLIDYEKVIGGASEATWLVMNRGLQADVQEGAGLTEKQLDALEDSLQDYVHGLRRILQTEGVNIQELGGAVVNPSGLLDKIIQALSAGSDIPARILVGSERGNLASTQDQETWEGMIEGRQNQYAWPKILKKFIDWCVVHGALPPHGVLTAEWPPLSEPTIEQELSLNETKAKIIKALGVPVAMFNEIRQWVLLEELEGVPAVPIPPAKEGEPATQAEAHGGVLVFAKCPLCGGTQGMRYAGHGPLILCINCKRTYDPTYWGHNRG